jgi:hypothetical protein
MRVSYFVPVFLSSLVYGVPLSNCARSESPPATQQGNLWKVSGAGVFTNTHTFTFSGSSLPSGLAASDWEISDAPPAPYHHTFSPNNVKIANGVMKLIVPGGQTGPSISSAEVSTTAAIGNILYASVRTTAILGGVPGSCNGE